MLLSFFEQFIFNNLSAEFIFLTVYLLILTVKIVKANCKIYIKMYFQVKLEKKEMFVDFLETDIFDLIACLKSPIRQ